MRRALLLFLLAALPVLADEVDDSRRIYRDALAAYEKKDYAVYLEKVRAAQALRPNHPTLLVRLAAGLALNGQRDAALAPLERVASMGLVADLAASGDFASLQGMPRFDAVVKRFEANARPVGQAKQELVIDRLGLVPEGMAYDMRGKRWFVGSMRTKTIFAVDAQGNVSELVKDLPSGPFGMVHDATRNVLWVGMTALPQVEGFNKEDTGKSALLKIDARSGRLLETLRADDTAEHHFNDVALANDGTVYVSDSASPTIFRVHGKRLEPFVRGPFAALQGLAVRAHILYVADYSKGIFAVDRRTLDVRLLNAPANVAVLGIDGLYAASSDTLVATQNGVAPNRILRIRLAPGGLGIASADTLLANASGLGDPTLGVVIGDRFHFNANAQWELFADDGTITDPVKLKEAVVLSVPIR